jgi:hypothetical protein
VNWLIVGAPTWQSIPQQPLHASPLAAFGKPEGRSRLVRDRDKVEKNFPICARKDSLPCPVSSH